MQFFLTPTVHHFIAESIKHITSINHFSLSKTASILAKKQKIQCLITTNQALSQLLVFVNLPPVNQDE